MAYEQKTLQKLNVKVNENIHCIIYVVSHLHVANSV